MILLVPGTGAERWAKVTALAVLATVDVVVPKSEVEVAALLFLDR